MANPSNLEWATHPAPKVRLTALPTARNLPRPRKDSQHSMKHRTEKVDNDVVHIIDDALSPAFNQKLYDYFSRSGFTQSEGASEVTAAYKHLARDFDLDRLERSAFGKLANDVIREFVNEPQEIYRGYCNLMLFGHLGGMHRDCSVGWNDISALYFICPEWKANWGGELHMFDKTGDAQLAIAPRPGRLVLFRGKTQHSATAPSVICTLPRFSIALKCRDFTQNVEAQLGVYSAAYALVNTPPDVRARSVYMIGLLDHPKATQTLAEIAGSAGTPMACRSQALKMLLRKDRSWFPRIVALLGDSLPEIRIAAAQALASPISSDTRTHIENRLANENDSRVRDALLTALLSSSQDIDSIEADH
jgi:SM-20-related protein